MKLSDAGEAKYRKQDYARPGPPIQGVEIVELRRFQDDGGSLTELGRLAGGRLEGQAGLSLAQINFSTLEPRSIKGLHVHRVQTDVWFVPPGDQCSVGNELFR